jgi:hypothetical protein
MSDSQPAAGAQPAFVAETFNVDLPCGTWDENGTHITSCVVRELVGTDRDVIGHRDIRKSGVKMISAVLANNVTEVPGIELPPAPRPGQSISSYDRRAWAKRIDFFATLTAHDRSHILLSLRRKSLGDNFDSKMSCNECGNRWTEHFDLGEGGVKPFDVSSWTAKGLPSKWMRDVEFTRGDKTYSLTLRLPTADDEEAISQRAGGNIFEASRMTLERILVAIDGQPIKNFGSYPAWFHDEAWVAYAGVAPESAIPTQVECSACGAVNLARISALTVLFGLRDTETA